MTNAHEWEEDAHVEYAILNGGGRLIAGGFDSAEDAIQAAKLIDEPCDVEARRTLRRRVWCSFDGAFDI